MFNLGVKIWGQPRAGGSAPVLNAGAKIASLGDSELARGHAATTAGAFTTIQNKANLELAWALARTPYGLHNIWWDNTATAAHDIPTYGFASAQDNLYRGANFGYSGDTCFGITKRVAQVISSTAQVVYVTAGTNTDSPNTSAEKIADLNSVVTSLTNAGIYVILGTIRPRWTGDRETLNNVLNTTNGSAVVRLIRNAHSLTNTSSGTKEMEFVSPGVTVGGITLLGRIASGSGGYTVNVVDVNTIDITTPTTANATITNGGGSFTWHRNVFTDLAGVANIGLCLMPSDGRHQVHLDTNAWIRAQAGRNKVFVADLDPALKDPTRSALTGVADPYSYAVMDGVHLAPRGAAPAGAIIESVLGQIIKPGAAFDTNPNNNNILTNGTLTGTTGITPSPFTGQSPTGWQCDGGLITNTTGTFSVVSNPDTGGQYVEINGTVDGLGTAGTFSVIRFTPSTKPTTGYTSSDYVQAIFEIEIVSQTDGILAAFQATLGTGSTITARGLGQTRADYNTEPYPSTARRYWVSTEPYLAGGAASLNPRLDMSIRKDLAGTFTYRIRRVMLRTVTSPVDQFPWITQILLNGDFSGGTTSWVGFGSGGKSVASGQATFAATAAFDSIGQTGLTMVAGKYYEVKYDLVVTAGSIFPKLVGGAGAAGVTRSSSGTYTERIQAVTGNNEFDIIPGGSGFTGTVDNITVFGPYSTSTVGGA